MESIEVSPGSSDSNKEEAPSRQSEEVIPAAAAIPAAEPVERGRFVLHLHNRDDDDDSDDGGSVENNDNNSNGSPSIKTPDSPKSFNSDEIFEDVECGDEHTSDHDLERLLGPPPMRRANVDNEPIPNSLETDFNDDDSDDSTRSKRKKEALCSCCPSSVRRGPCRMLLSITGRDGSVPATSVGNMIIILPKFFHSMGFGIMGPHWFGPVVCVALLTFATSYFTPKAYHNIGLISAIMCVLFYISGIVSLCIVSCSDPGVVKSRGGEEERGRNGYAGVSVSAGGGWRFCDVCSVYQPPDAVHCPECNVCIEGYDHHCPWMGTCIGKKNFTSFVAFNLSWLFYLLYAIVWVTFFGTAFAEGVVESSSDDY